jgi:hypothetical protein
LEVRAAIPNNNNPDTPKTPEVPKANTVSPTDVGIAACPILFALNLNASQVFLVAGGTDKIIIVIVRG